MQEKFVKGGLAGLTTILTFFYGNLTPIFYLMLGFELADYITGMAVAKWYPTTPDDGWNSKKATQGFVKKIAYVFLVGVAWGVDYLILAFDTVADMPIEWQAYFGVFAMCYLILTEGISILENTSKMGIEIPFLTTALKIFREKIITQGEVMKQ